MLTNDIVSFEKLGPGGVDLEQNSLIKVTILFAQVLLTSELVRQVSANNTS